MTTPRTQRKPRLALRMTLMLTAALLVFGGVFAVKAFIGAQTNQFFDNMPQPAAAVSAAAAVTERWADDAEAVGTLIAVNGTDVTTEAGGVIRAIEFEAGQPVKAGAVLLRLNTDNEAATLKSLETSARLAKVQADRWQQLGQDKLVSLDEVQQRVAAAASAQAQADAQRALIAQKTIRAPFGGELGIRKVNLGQFLSPGDAIVSLQQLDPIYLDFSLPEQHMDKLKP
ncbi:MAG TPA: efflux RND transporter periplasmic adaptor subunit, partial [Burkholderiaceae bacterium]|nr:efflux RND transporter periplasmic adaptor subunit [Burkholderiaceae bacterium]